LTNITLNDTEKSFDLDRNADGVTNRSRDFPQWITWVDNKFVWWEQLSVGERAGKQVELRIRRIENIVELLTLIRVLVDMVDSLESSPFGLSRKLKFLNHKLSHEN
jgi:hypothetical protein